MHFKSNFHIYKYVLKTFIVCVPLQKEEHVRILLAHIFDPTTNVFLDFPLFPFSTLDYFL